MSNYHKIGRTEISPKRKKNLYIGILFFILGFVFLATVGSDINKNSYLLRGFLAPFFLLLGMVTITISLVKSEKNDNSNDGQ